MEQLKPMGGALTRQTDNVTCAINLIGVKCFELVSHISGTVIALMHFRSISSFSCLCHTFTNIAESIVH